MRHRDIKPENVLIYNDRVMLSDFGFAQVYGGDQGETLGSSGPPGINNYRYGAPEVLEGRTRSEKSDVYSLGCTFVEMVVTILYHRCKLNPWPDERWFGEGPDTRVVVRVFAHRLDQIIAEFKTFPMVYLNEVGLGGNDGILVRTVIP